MTDSDREHFLGQLRSYEDLVGNIRALVEKPNTELLEAVRETVRERNDAQRLVSRLEADLEVASRNEQARRELAIVRRILAAAKDETTVEAICRVLDERELAEGDQDHFLRAADKERLEVIRVTPRPLTPEEMGLRDITKEAQHEAIKLLRAERDAARRMASALRAEAGWGEPDQKKFWPLPWE